MQDKAIIIRRYFYLWALIILERQPLMTQKQHKNLKMKAARALKGMSQEDLAKAAGVTRQTIGMIESGAYNPTLNLCIAICKALDQTLDGLFWNEEDN